MFLLDTNVVSESRLTRRNAGFDYWWASADPEELYISVVSLGEMGRGVEKLRPRDPARADEIGRWLTELRAMFAERLISLDENAAIEWGRMSADRSRPIADTMIAATAKVHDLTLVTRNVRDVEGIDIRVLNPFS